MWLPLTGNSFYLPLLHASHLFRSAFAAAALQSQTPTPSPAPGTHPTPSRDSPRRWVPGALPLECVGVECVGRVWERCLLLRSSFWLAALVAEASWANSLGGPGHLRFPQKISWSWWLLSLTGIPLERFVRYRSSACEHDRIQVISRKCAKGADRHLRV